MDYNELTRLAMTEGPMQQLALKALLRKYEATNRQARRSSHTQPFDPYKYMDEYVNAVMEQGPQSRVPSGDRDPNTALMEQAQNEAVAQLMKRYEVDAPWYEDLGNIAAGIGDYVTSPEGVTNTIGLVRDTITPGFSQLDSYNWSRENMNKYWQLREKEPLTALGYLPLAGLGALGTVPGVASVIGGGRKLSAGLRGLMEGFI